MPGQRNCGSRLIATHPRSTQPISVAMHPVQLKQLAVQVLTIEAQAVSQLTTRIDVFRNGHAMARPVPGLIWGEARRHFAVDGERLRFAHADVSGFSLFEEAQYRGVLAAERTLRRLGLRFRSSLV